MTQIELKTTDQVLAIVQRPTIASGDQNSVQIKVYFDSKWDDYVKSAVFYTAADPKIYEVILNNGVCTVPHEVLATTGTMYIGIRGTNPDGLVKTTTMIHFRIVQGAPMGDATPEEPTPDTYQQILTLLAANKATVSQTADGAVIQIADHNGTTTASIKHGKDGKDGIDGRDGQDGYTPVKGVDYVDGKDGQPGKDGRDGYTPQKNVDYFDGKDGRDGKDGNDYVLTEADKEEIAEQAAALVDIPEGGGSGITVTAKPGQLIRVKEVDENGNPTAWEAAEDMPWAEGGRVEVPIVAEWEDDDGDGVADIGWIIAPLDLVIGKTYTVNWHGVGYSVVCLDAAELTYGEVSGAVLGNVKNTTGVDTGEPFVIMAVELTDGVYGIVQAITGTIDDTMSIYFDGEVVHPLDPKYLPEGVPYCVDGGMVEILPETQVLDDEEDTDEGLLSIPVPFSLTAGETYSVNWNGTEYTCVAIDSAALGEPGFVLLGDVYTLSGGQVGEKPTGEPFVMMVVPGIGNMVVSLDEMAEGDPLPTVAIYHDDTKIRKLDPRCLPDDVGGGVFVVAASLATDTAEVGSAEIGAAMMQGKTVLLNIDGIMIATCVNYLAGQGAFFVKFGTALGDNGVSEINGVTGICVKPDGSIIWG